MGLSISHLYTHMHTHQPSPCHRVCSDQAVKGGFFLPSCISGLVYSFPRSINIPAFCKESKGAPCRSRWEAFYLFMPFFFIHTGLNCDKALLNDLALTSKNVRDVIIVMISPSCMIGNVSAANWVRSKRRKGITPLVANESDAGRKSDWNRKHEGWSMSPKKVSFSSIFFKLKLIFSERGYHLPSWFIAINRCANWFTPPLIQCNRRDNFFLLLLFLWGIYYVIFCGDVI